MNISRRRVILSILGLGALASFPVGCRGNSTNEPRVRKGVINLGLYSLYKDGLTLKSIERVGIIKDGAGLSAISLICTHQECLLNTALNGFSCPCHGAQFNAEGGVISGPAKRDLERYHLALNNKGEIELDFSKLVAREWRLKLPQAIHN